MRIEFASKEWLQWSRMLGMSVATEATGLAAVGRNAQDRRREGHVGPDRTTAGRRGWKWRSLGSIGHERIGCIGLRSAGLRRHGQRLSSCSRWAKGGCDSRRREWRQSDGLDRRGQVLAGAERSGGIGGVWRGNQQERTTWAAVERVGEVYEGQRRNGAAAWDRTALDRDRGEGKGSGGFVRT